MLRTPEIELLLLCARPRLGDSAMSRLVSLLRQQLDWQSILRLAEYYRTIPLLAFHLHHLSTDLPGTDIQDRLQEQHRNSTRHNLVLAAELLRLIDLLSAEGVQVVPFKGPVAAMLAYHNMSLRACGDIDLLVKPADHATAERLLESRGYVVTERYQNAMQSSLWHEQRRISIDLHWGIPPQRLRLNSDRLWEHLGPVDLLGRPVMTFSRCDTLLVLATNVVKEYWKPSLHHLSDIAALTSAYTDEEWITAFDRAREIGCQRILVAALLLAHRLLDTSLPRVGPVRLFRHAAINKVVDEVQDHLFSPSDEQSPVTATRAIHHRDAHIYYLTLTDSALQRSRDWLRWAGTPNSADQAFVKLPRMLSFLYFFIRPLRLLIKHL